MINQLKDDIIQLEKYKQGLEESIASLERDTDILQKRYDDFSKQTDELGNNIKGLLKTQADLTKKNMEIKKDTVSRLILCEEKEKTIERVREGLKTEQEEFYNRKKEFDDAKSIIEEDLKEQRKENERLSMRFLALTDETEAVKQQYLEKMKGVDNERASLLAYERELTEIDAELKDNRAEIAQKKGLLANERKRLEADTQTLADNISKYKGDLLVLDGERAKIDEMLHNARNTVTNAEILMKNAQIKEQRVIKLIELHKLEKEI